MIIKSPETPFGFTVFCDDFRSENNGKLIYIGVYPTEMIIYGALPCLLPSLCAIVRYSEGYGESNDPVLIKIFGPGKDESLIDIELDTASMRSVPPPPPVEGEAASIATLIPVRISPMPIEQQGRIKVRAYRGDVEIRLGTLAVRLEPLSASRDPPA